MRVKKTKSISVLLGLSALLNFGAMGSALAEPTKYSLTKGVSVTSIKKELKKEDGRELCFVSVSIKNETGQDRTFEIELAGDEGLMITTYTGYPKRSPLKSGAEETATFKTLLTKIPEHLEVTVRPYTE